MYHLRELRTQKGLTQAELSKTLQVSASSIGMYEQGRREPDNETLGKIASYFNVTTDYLLGRTDEPQGTGFQKGLLGDKNDDSPFMQQVREQMANIQVTPYEEALLKAYRAANDYERTIINATLKLGEFTDIEAEKERKINTAILNLKKSIMSIDGLQCSEIASVNIASGDIDHLLKTYLIRTIIMEQVKDSYTYLVPEMFYMKDFINSLRSHLTHYDAEPQLTVDSFKTDCKKYLEELRTYEYEKCMSTSDSAIKDFLTMTVNGYDYCIINNDFYRIEQNGPGQFILTKMPRPPYDPKPTKKEESSNEYRIAA
jgi:transcriptional regulator with XRE-family HTH domain